MKRFCRGTADDYPFSTSFPNLNLISEILSTYRISLHMNRVQHQAMGITSVRSFGALLTPFLNPQQQIPRALSAKGKSVHVEHHHEDTSTGSRPHPINGGELPIKEHGRLMVEEWIVSPPHPEKESMVCDSLYAGAACSAPHPEIGT